MNWKFWKKEVPDLVPPKKVIPMPLDEGRIAQRDIINIYFKEILLQLKRSASHIKEDIAIVNHEPETNTDVRQFTLGKKTPTHIIIATLSIHAIPNDKITTQIKKGNKKHVQTNQGLQHTPGSDGGSVREKRV